MGIAVIAHLKPPTTSHLLCSCYKLQGLSCSFICHKFSFGHELNTVLYYYLYIFCKHLLTFTKITSNSLQNACIDLCFHRKIDNTEKPLYRGKHQVQM